jgi:predicted dithiol-disulfide oxidoreductase (DUF899 family)
MSFRHSRGLRIVVPYYMQLLDRTPKGRMDEFRATRHDEYEDAAARS